VYGFIVSRVVVFRTIPTDAETGCSSAQNLQIAVETKRVVIPEMRSKMGLSFE